MAGILLGVEMHRRRKSRTNFSQSHQPSSSHRSLLQPSLMAAATPSTMDDEAALNARQRLSQKLGYFHPSRLDRIQGNEGGGNKTMMMSTRDSHGHLVSRILGKPWRFRNNNSESKGQLCAVCLEDFRAEQQVKELPCSHKYHANCLLPWLADHPSCPSCRTPVEL